MTDVADKETKQKQKAEEATAEIKEETAAEETKTEEVKAEEKPANDEMAVLNDKYLRVCAEYDNFRRRSAKEKEGIYADAVCDTVKEFLPLFDNLERAGQFTEAEKVAEGLAMMAKMTDGMLEKVGVVRYGVKGESFDPNQHNAVMHVDDENYGENEITDVFEIGYRRSEKVIRFATVKVAN